MSGLVAVAKMRKDVQARPPRSDSGLHVLRAADWFSRAHGGAGERKRHEVKVGKFPFAGNSKATILGSHDGFVKIVSDAKYGEILGVHIVGFHRDRIIAEAVAVLELEGTVEEMMFTITRIHSGRSHARRLRGRGGYGDQRMRQRGGGASSLPLPHPIPARK